MKIIGLFFLAAFASAESVWGFTSEFVILTPSAGEEHDGFQPWLFSDRNQPEVVTVVVPFHKGMKKYWLVSTSRELKDEELNFRALITASYKPVPEYVSTVVPLSPELNDLGQPVTADFIVFRVRKDELVRHYVYHDFAVSVDDGGYFRTYRLSAYPIGEQFDDRLEQEMAASREKRQNEAEKLIRNDEASRRWNREWREKQKREQGDAEQSTKGLEEKAERSEDLNSDGVAPAE